MTPEQAITYLTLSGIVVVALTGLFRLRGDMRKTAGDTKALQIDGESKLIDQLQEELARYRTSEISRIERVEAEITALKAEDATWRAYVYSLRHHIYERLDPPPPEWPESLRR